MQPEKIAPELLVALDKFQKQGRPGLTPHIRSLGLVSAVDSPKPARTIVFLHCDEQAKFDHLSSLGVRVNQPKGKVRTAILPLEGLDRLSDEQTVKRIVPSRYLRLLMDVAPGKVNLPAFRSNSGLSGNGVIVGIVDSGIDPKHPAFSGRVLRIWDQVMSGPGVPEGSYGAELTGAMLEASRDTHGHGTHVAGIAAGQDAKYGGVAPKANLLIVRSDLQDAHIADGIRYIFRVAGELGRPAVINLSLGGHWDPHDGTDSLSQIVTSESGSGRIVCCAAGNEGDDNIHAQVTIPAGATRTVRFRVPPGFGGTAILNGWYSGSAALEVSIQVPSRLVTPWQKVITAGNPSQSYSLEDSQVDVSTPGPDPTNGDHGVQVFVSGAAPGTPIEAGIWKLRLRNPSSAAVRLDVWIIDDSSPQAVFFTGKSVQDSMKVGSPGAAASAITVASYTTKVSWKDLGENVREVGLTLDDISGFSSEGPLRNGTQKPEVAAPGAMIASALSADSSVPESMVVASGFRIMAGTSMATPFITGVVALLLERNPSLDPNGVKALLRANSAIPGRPAGTFDPKWGFGLINALNL
ncbi:S8 family peptidase [Candidatus Acetothermia bacterium]|nr:S8 family peptidase [Candidatus Acetothermia bacterium]